MPVSNYRTHHQTILHYTELRRMVYETTTAQIGDNAKGLSLSHIDVHTARLADLWKQVNIRGYRDSRSTWNWTSAWQIYSTKPKRFEIAVWASGKLCGLCYGVPTSKKSKLGLTLIEGTPERPSPLGRPVFPVISYAATLYAIAIGAEELYIVEPINDAVMRYYQSFGFEGPIPYSCKRIALRKRL